MYMYSDVQAAAKLPIKKWWLLNADYEYGHACYDGFTKGLKKLRPDVEFVGEGWPKLSTTDWGPTLAPIAVSNAEGLYLTHMVGKALKTAGLYKKVTILGHDWGNMNILYPSREFIEDGMWGGTLYAFWLLKDNPQSAYLVREYMKDRANPPGTGAMASYASLQAIATAAKQTGSTDKEKIIDFLEGRKLDTLVGPVTIQEFDHQAVWPFWFGKTKTTPEYPSFPILVDTTKYQEQGYATKEEVLQARGAK
jgi:branched-chain amino acid transport system substrate-binding protein